MDSKKQDSITDAQKKRFNCVHAGVCNADS